MFSPFPKIAENVFGFFLQLLTVLTIQILYWGMRNQAVEKDQTSAHIDFNVNVHSLSCMFILCM